MNRSLAAIFLFLLSACHQPAVDKKTLSANIAANVLKSGMTLMTYKRDSLQLYRNFTAFDSSYNRIDKGTFLEALTTGDYLPVKVAMAKDSLAYALYPVHGEQAVAARGTLQYFGTETLDNYKREGETFPAMHFIDVNGRVYDSANTKGKILVLKCWFIHCTACVAEFPELNKLVYDYRDRDDVVFASFAFDAAEDLQAFVLKKPFSYGVIAVSKEFMEDLRIKMYPTHILVNKQGKIVKMVHDASELKDVLQELAGS